MLLIFLPNIVIFIYVYHSISDHSGSQRDQITRKRSRNQQKRTMEGEMYNFTKALFSILLSLTYCYAIGKIIPKDFWGRRWNIMVTSILRPTVYGPLLKTCSPIIGRKWAPVPAIMGTFTVSAIMHELIFYYLGRVNPTWEITRFFVLHGVCLVIEIALKKVVSRRWQLPRLISTPLTIGFVVVTGFWLFVPQILRCRADTKAFQEYSAVSIFLKNMTRAFVFGS
ncbi:acyl-CoA--sterol O-acyltransferase 1 isoform X2 [Ricinus communis]|uniref:acyl-CoA--sterol O-acyltransferase 1 isoform X2 n=1 Tax=Ricinus communis TaxID=3988 RepID=UPI00201ACEA8|nr:acyl-CoA--sterol O-acyltransferase 1 isoform X2 [Ricinus communis]